MCSKDSRSLANCSNLFQISSHGSSILRYRHTTLGMGLGSPLSALEGGEYEPSAGPWKTPTTNIRDFILIFTTSRPEGSHCTCCFSHFCRSHRAVGLTRFVPRDRCSGGISVRRSRAACASRLKSSCMRCGIHFSRCRFNQDGSTLARRQQPFALGRRLHIVNPHPLRPIMDEYDARFDTIPSKCTTP